MPVSMDWYIRDRVILQTYSGVFTIPELKASILQVGEMVRAGKAPVHSLADLRDVTKFPMNIAEISRAIQPIDNNLIGWTIAITDSSMIEFLCGVVSRFFDARFTSAKTLDEAMTFLREHDVTLETDINTSTNV